MAMKIVGYARGGTNGMNLPTPIARIIITVSKNIYQDSTVVE